MKYFLIVMILISTNVIAFERTVVRNVAGMTRGANQVNVGVRLIDVKYTKYLEAHINPSIRNGMVGHFINEYESMCMDIAQRLFMLNVPVTEITTTSIRDIPELGWKTKTCKVNPVINITVD